MLYKFYNFISKYFRKRKTDIKNQEGFTIVEVVIALVIISIITVVLVRGTMVSVNTLKINREKTKALAIANEKIELIKAMNYKSIVSEDPEWLEAGEYPMLFEIEDGYDISYQVTDVYEGEGKYKQLEISVSREPMKVPISVISQIYPVMGTEEEVTEYPPPTGLEIESDILSGSDREIKLIWQPPDTELEVNRYNIYRGGSFITSAPIEEFIDKPGDDDVYSYYVTASYEDGIIESGPSNIVNTAGEYDYPPPQNLRIVGYSQGGTAYTVSLEWDPPDTGLTVIRYVVYRGGEETEVTWTGETSCNNRIGKIDYTFYVIAVYEGDIYSDPSNEVETQH